MKPLQWTQHFSLDCGRPHCLFCLALHEPQPDSPFCSERCAAAFGAARSQACSRDQLFLRERGVCQACGLDAHALFQRVAALSEPQARMQALMSSPLHRLAAELLRKGAENWLYVTASQVNFLPIIKDAKPRRNVYGLYRAKIPDAVVEAFGEGKSEL